MKFIRYTLLLVFLALLEVYFNFSSIYLRAQPEIFFLFAYIVMLQVKAKYAVPVFFIAGLICDFFSGQHLGVSTFLYVLSAVFLLYFFSAVHAENIFLQFLFLALTLVFTLFFRALLQRFAFPSEDLLVALLNNLFFTLLLAPVVNAFLALPYICPWKKREYTA